MAKLLEGDASAALRTLVSDESVIAPTADTLAVLRDKHPNSPIDTRSVPRPTTESASFDEVQMMFALSSFKPSSAGGLDCLKPTHLKDLTAKYTSEAGLRLRRSLTRLCDTFAHGTLPSETRDLFFASNLIALRKKDGGIRPIAIGNVFRRLASKIIAKKVIPLVSAEFKPIQLGVGVPGGCEAAVHAFRSLIESETTSSDKNLIAIKLDMRNAFNSIRRDHILEVCLRRTPSVYPLAYSAYACPSVLLASGNVLESQTGVQQGDPLGPLLFALGVDDIAKSITSPFNVWYLDDATLGGPPLTVIRDLTNILPALDRIGLEINPSKCELINISCNQVTFAEASESIKQLLHSVKDVSIDELELLGSPISPAAVCHSLSTKRSQLESLTDKLLLLDSHPAMFLLSKCLWLPRFLYTLRSSPCYRLVDQLSLADSILRNALRTICNIDPDDLSWEQLSLPVRLGGLGLSTPLDAALPAYLSSIYAGQSLILEILSKFPESSPIAGLANALLAWNNVHLEQPTEQVRQRSWSSIVYQKKIERLTSKSDQHRLACIRAASQPQSGAWLNALPSAAVGTLLDNDSYRIGICIRLGLRVCTPHPCRCGSLIDEFGLHPLSCRSSAGRFPRHSALNDAVRRALDSAGYPSSLEPIGLNRGDGKRPDGITLFPFTKGKCLIWDCTCTDTFSPTNLVSSATNPGSASTAAELRKIDKYAALSNSFHFIPIAVETSGVFGPITLSFLRKIGSLCNQRADNPRESSYLFQRISIAIIRGNSRAILSAGCFNEQFF